MNLRRKILGYSVLVVVALIFLAWLAGLLHFGKIAPGLVAVKPAAPAGRVLTVTMAPISRELEVLGEVMSPSLARISSQVSGRVTRIWVEAGDRVKPGAPLIALSGEEYQARLNQAQAGVAQAQAQWNQISADYQRFQYLLKEGAASPREFEGVEARYKSAQAALSAAQAQAKEASTMQGYTVVRAPRAAVVASRQATVGDLAQPGQLLLSLYNPEELKVEGEINDSFRDRVRIGEHVKVSVPAVNWQGELTIAEIFPISQSLSRTFKVRTGTVRDPKLMPGMFARLSLPLGSAMGMLIPQDAVQQVGQLAMVKVLAGEGPQLRQVKLGRPTDGQVEVLAGLKPGDQIILLNGHVQ